MKPCGDCGVCTGEHHQHGCDIERCALCGGQLISCACVYTLSGMDTRTLEPDHPRSATDGPTKRMWAIYFAEVEKHGGRLGWTGDWPGAAELRAWGWFAKRNPIGVGWIACAEGEPGAIPDMNRLNRDARWDKQKRQWVKRTL